MKQKFFIPLEKQSKKARRAYFLRQRRDWQGMNPVTRVAPNSKIYNRQKMKQTSFGE